MNRMASSLTAPPPPDWAAAWHAIASLKPRLRADITIRTQYYRDEPWWIFEHTTSNATYRLDAAAYRAVCELDGKTSVADIAERLPALGDLTRDDLVALLGQLQYADFLDGSVSEDPSLLARHAQRSGRGPLTQIKNPLGIRIPLCDPDRWLDALVSRLQPLCHPLIGKSALLVCFAATLLAIQHWPSLAAYSAIRAIDLSSVLLLALIYPIVKGLHELAHAVMVKYHGGEVHEMGIMLLVFFPVPYVDASASAGFEHKRARIAVAAAGIITELVLAAVALLVWLNVQDGTVRNAAFTVALIGSVSTLLFNGNPLLRFDGYYVLSDAIEIPNLASRARAYWLYLIRRYCFGLSALHSPASARGERRWLLAFGFASGAYRLMILGAIALMLTAAVPLLGALLAAWVLVSQVLLPLGRGLRYVATGTDLAEHRRRAITVTVVLLALAGYLVGLQPAPYWSRVEGIVRLPESAQVREQEPGFVRQVLAADGAAVAAGQAIARLEDETLQVRHERLRWRLDELEARRAQQIVSSPTNVALISESIGQTRAELAELRRRLERLTVRAPAAGTLQLTGGSDWLGRYLEKGDRVANVIANDRSRIIAVVPQATINAIRNSTNEITLRTPAQPGRSVPAKLVTVTPAASERLPSAALGSRGGGAIAVDSRDPGGTRTLDDVFHVELTPNAADAYLRPGTRAIVRFEHAKESIAVQLSRAARRLFMAELNW